MTGLTFDEQNEWRESLSNQIENCITQNKAICINPVKFYREDNPEDYDSDLEVMRFDLHKVKMSDLIIVNFNKPDSLGTMAEIAIAYDNDIPIIGLNTNQYKLHPWQQDMCNKIFSDEEELLLYVKKYYLFC